MAEKILTQRLSVSDELRRRGDAQIQSLVYWADALLPDGAPPPEARSRQIHEEDVRADVEQIRSRIEELIGLAKRDAKREGAAIEPEAAQLARDVFPEDGFAQLIEPVAHPLLVIQSGLASTIPWEALEEWYFVCVNSECRAAGKLIQPHGASTGEAVFCQYCGLALSECGGKLAIDRHLCHEVPGGEKVAPGGTDFLLIGDPTGDLCEPDADKQGVCADHLEQLERMLEDYGYRIIILQEQNATHAKVTEALRNPNLAGMYYFGHGVLPADGSDGCLFLSDRRLRASQIGRINPAVRFVFLNACEGANVGSDWGLERDVHSVGRAFARGGKTVIAPVFPVVNVQAANSALEFFQAALEGDCFAEALRKARQTSFARYEQQDLPDVSWMAYRYFGNPNRTLRAPKEPQPPAPGVARPVVSRLFDDHDHLDTDVFAFNVDAVLIRAAKRRNRQNRARATVTDFVAGLVRVGDLTRHLFSEYGVPPDESYHRILDHAEAGEPGAASASDDQEQVSFDGESGSAALGEWARGKLAELREFFARLIIRDREEFDERLLAVLRRADETAQGHGEGQEEQQVSEHDVLAAILDAGCWPAGQIHDLPPAAWVGKWLASRESKRTVDANGRLRLDALSPAALRIVEAAHAQAQQRGVSPIPNRLMLAAFLENPNGHVAGLCKRHNVDSDRLARVLIAVTKSRSPESFELSHESCRRVVLPMLKRAHALRASCHLPQITETALFKAYCEVASPEIKDSLAGLKPPLKVNLDQLGKETVIPSAPSPGRRPTAAPPKRPATDPPQQPIVPDPFPPDNPKGEKQGVRFTFDPGATRILEAATQFAILQGYSEVRSPHLFAAMITDGTALPAVLRRRDVHPAQLMRTLLRVVPPKVAPEKAGDQVGWGPNVQNILQRACRNCRTEGRDTMTEHDLRIALFADREGIVVRSLAQLRLGWLVFEDYQADEQAPDHAPDDASDDAPDDDVDDGDSDSDDLPQSL